MAARVRAREKPERSSSLRIDVGVRRRSDGLAGLCTTSGGTRPRGGAAKSLFADVLAEYEQRKNGYINHHNGWIVAETVAAACAVVSVNHRSLSMIV